MKRRVCFLSFVLSPHHNRWRDGLSRYSNYRATPLQQVLVVIDLRRVYHTLAIRQKLASWLRGYRYPTSGAVLGSFLKKKANNNTNKTNARRKKERDMVRETETEIEK